jgi:hydroxymethylglutaryl-CoA reductase
MSVANYIEGFSRLSHSKKVEIIAGLTSKSKEFIRSLKTHKHPDHELQKIYRDFSENNMTDFHLPFGIAPNFLINKRIYHIPMVIEESSVVAAAASAAKFWSERGGFHCSVRSTTKIGHVHFIWEGDFNRLESLFKQVKKGLLSKMSPVISSMVRRGGGISEIALIRKPEILNYYYQLEVSFETVDSMGANFINTCLELLAAEWKQFIETYPEFKPDERRCEIIMAILSNYTPDCIVECNVSSAIGELNDKKINMTGKTFSTKFLQAVLIAREDRYRAVTHNKGIFNGIDAVVMATGNDYRAVEANGHAYASRNGKYQGLTMASIEDERFHFQLEMPMTIGTVGGLTRSHPLATYALEILGNPDAKELMQIIAAVGLANNFSAIRSLITTGIQKGHMYLHLSNVLKQLNATEKEKHLVLEHFQGRTVSYSGIKEYLNNLRKS